MSLTQGRRGRWRKTLVFIFLISGTLFAAHLTFAQGPPAELLEELKLFSKAMGAINYAYVEPVSFRQLFYQAMKGMLSSMDRYTFFIDPELFKKFQTHVKGEYAGVGIALEIKDNRPSILQVVPRGPAEKAGLRLMDQILKVNGTETLGKPLPEVSELIRGEVGTEVVLTIHRLKPEKVWDVTLKREKIEIDAVKDVRIVGKSIGYIRIETFQDHTVEQFDKAAASLKEKGMKALVIDLRNNDGGLLPKAVELAERFLPEGKKIISVSSKVPEQRKEYFSSGKYQLPDYPLVVLVNQNSASASEIFSAAVQDNERGKIVGVKTFGKASVQSVIPLDDVSAMKLTTARYVSPKGRIIDKVGIQPDVEVQNGPPGAPNTDHQTLKAIELLKPYF